MPIGIEAYYFAGESYSKMEPDPETSMPSGLGLESISDITMLMRENKDRMVFARMTTPKS